MIAIWIGLALFAATTIDWLYRGSSGHPETDYFYVWQRLFRAVASR